MINGCRSALVKYVFSSSFSGNDQNRNAFVTLLESPILACLLCHFGQTSYSKFIFICRSAVFRVFAKIVENSIIILFAILGKKLTGRNFDWLITQTKKGRRDLVIILQKQNVYTLLPNSTTKQELSQSYVGNPSKPAKLNLWRSNRLLLPSLFFSLRNSMLSSCDENRNFRPHKKGSWIFGIPLLNLRMILRTSPQNCGVKLPVINSQLTAP